VVFPVQSSWVGQRISLAVEIAVRGHTVTRSLNVSRVAERKVTSSLLPGRFAAENDTAVSKNTTWTLINEVSFVCVQDESIHHPLPQELQKATVVHHSNGQQRYFPLCNWDEFWMIESQFHEYNETAAVPPLNISFTGTSLWKFLLFQQLETAFALHENMGTMGKKEFDETKRIFLETNPWFLGLTCAVSLLHLLFEYLAFSNDVTFWKGRKNFTGLSLRAVLMNCYFSTVIFLYLLDGETSWTVLAPSGIGVLIEYWKLNKCVVVTRKGPLAFSISFSQTYSKTRSHDDRAMRVLLYIMVPCLVGYSLYSAVYEEHKGWYRSLLERRFDSSTFLVLQ
jgi:hypothetical protein